MARTARTPAAFARSSISARSASNSSDSRCACESIISKFGAPPFLPLAFDSYLFTGSSLTLLLRLQGRLLQTCRGPACRPGLQTQRATCRLIRGRAFFWVLDLRRLLLCGQLNLLARRKARCLRGLGGLRRRCPRGA